MDGRMDGQMNGRTTRWTTGQTDRRTDGWMDRQMDRQRKIHLLCMGRRNGFFSCVVVSVFLFVAGISFLCYLRTFWCYESKTSSHISTKIIYWVFLIENKPIGPAALWHMDRQTVSSIYYYCYVCTYVVRIMYDM
jgi:hypothetical protein